MNTRTLLAAVAVLGLLVAAPIAALRGGTHHPAALADVAPVTATMGPAYPTTASGSFTNPANVTASDGAVASAFMGGSLTTGGYMGFGGIPGNATGISVLVEVQAAAQDAGREAISSVALTSGGQAIATDATVTALGSSLAWVSRTFTSVTPAQIADPSFGVSVTASYVGPSGNNSNVSIDAVRVTVSYQPQPATPVATAASPVPTDTATPLDTATPAATDTPSASPTIVAPWDTDGTVVLIDALQRQLDAIRVFEVDAGSAQPQLIGEPPVDALSATLETVIQLEIEIAAREPVIAAKLLATERVLIGDWLATYPDVLASLSGRAQAWLDAEGLVTP